MTHRNRRSLRCIRQLRLEQNVSIELDVKKTTNDHRTVERRTWRDTVLKTIIGEDHVASATQSDDVLDSVCVAFAVSRAIREGIDRKRKSVGGKSMRETHAGIGQRNTGTVFISFE